MRIAAIPGFEFTGELRHPVWDEWYWDSFEPLQWRSHGSIGARLILRRLRSTDLGDYELTGEWRRPVVGEAFLGYDEVDVSVVRFAGAAYYGTFHILREKRA